MRPAAAVDDSGVAPFSRQITEIVSKALLVALGACVLGLVASAAHFGTAYGDAMLLTVIVVAPAVAGACCFVRSRAAVGERRAWRSIGLALLASAAGNSVAGTAPIDPSVTPAALPTVLWTLCYVFALRGFALLVRARLGRLDLTTWFDGILSALVVVMLLFWVVLLPGEAKLAGASAVPMIVPFLDSLLLGLFLAAAAQSGWRFGGWTPFIVGSGVLAVYDCTFAAQALSDMPAAFNATHFLLPVAYVAYGLATRSRPVAPKPFSAARSTVPVGFGVIAVVVLGIAALAPAVVPDVSAVLALLAIFAGLGRFGATLRENGQLAAAAQAQALSDALTGLANRRQLDSDLKHSLRSATHGRPHALAILDLDGFKRYNDTFGHQAGDDLLTEASARLVQAVGDRGSVYRLGGDEFCVLIEGCRDAEEAGKLIHKAAGAMSSHQPGFTVEASHGHVMLPFEATTADDAMRIADQRMYGHKASRADRRNARAHAPSVAE